MAIQNGYATLAQIRAEEGITDSGFTADDSKLELAVEAASRQIDGHCGWRFWQDGMVVTREFYADSPRCCYLFDDEAGDGISTTTGLVVKIDGDGDGTFETTLTIATDFILRPVNAADRVPVWPYTEIWLADNYTFPRPSNGRPGVQVTAKFGWPAVPDDVEKACLVQAQQLFKSKDAIFGAAAFGETTALRVRQALNPIAAALVEPYRKPSVG